MDPTLRHLESAPLAVWTVDRDLVFTSVGGGLFTRAGFPVPAAPGGKLTDFLGVGGPGRRGVASLNAHLAALRGEASQTRVSMRHGGSLLSCWPLRAGGGDGDGDPENDVVGALGMIVPLDERYAAEFGDADARDWFDQIMEHSPVAVLVRDRHRKLVWASPSYSRETGTPQAQLIGSGLEELFPRSVVSVLDGVYDQVMATGEPSGALVVADGKHVDMVVFPVRTRSGEALLGAVGIDVTARVRAETGHRAAEKRFEEFMNYCPAGAYLKDAAGRFVWTNRAFLDALGLAEDQVVGRSAAEITPPAGLPDEGELDARVLSGGTPVVSTGIWTGADGSTLHQVGYRFPVDTAEDTRLIGGIFLDDSAAVSAREDARRSASRYQRLFDRHPAPMLVVDEWGFVRDANPALCALLRRRLSSLRDLPLTDLAEVLDDEQDPAAAPRVPEGGDGSRSRLLVRRPGGHPPLRCTATRITIDRDPESTLLTLQDVREDPSGVVLLNGAECDLLERRAAGETAAEIASATGSSPSSQSHLARRLAQRLGWPPSAAAMTARAYVDGVLDARAWPPRVADAFRSG